MMATGFNISNILQEPPPCKANQLCSDNEDNNNNNINNAELAEEPWLSTSIVTQEQKCAHESTHRSERSFKTQCKDAEPKDPQGNPCNSAVSPKNSNNKNQTGNQVTPKPNNSTKSSVFEKWAAMDMANQRPLAKRQLSDFSKAFTSRPVKKTLVKEEDQTRDKVQSRSTQQDKRNDQIALNQHCFRRKLQKELISSTEDFNKVDTHAVSAGQEVRNICYK